MNEGMLSPCRACGQMISKNLGTGKGSCPHCGEADPHATEEELERRVQLKIVEERQQEEHARRLIRAQQQQIKKRTFWTQVIGWPLIIIGFILMWQFYAHVVIPIVKYAFF